MFFRTGCGKNIVNTQLFDASMMNLLQQKCKTQTLKRCYVSQQNTTLGLIFASNQTNDFFQPSLDTSASSATQSMTLLLDTWQAAACSVGKVLETFLRRKQTEENGSAHMSWFKTQVNANEQNSEARPHSCRAET